MKKVMNLVMMLVLCLYVAGVAYARVVVTDDFEDGILDTTKWIALESDHCSVIESDGKLNLSHTWSSHRPYLVTQGGWDPAAGAITVTGTVTLGSNGSFSLWTRSSGAYDSDGKPSGTGVIGSGVRVSFWLGASGSPLGVLYKEDTVWPWVNDTANATVDTSHLTKVAGDWNIVLTDNGSTVSLTVTNVDDPSNTGSIVWNTTFVPAVTSNKIVFGNGGASWDNITIDVYTGLVATNPIPADKAANVPVTTNLSWTAPEKYTGATYDIYFGTTEPNGLLADYGLTLLNTGGPQSETTIDPVPAGDLDNNTRYWWVVDSYEPNSVGAILHRGDYWSFTTISSLPAILEGPDSVALFAGETAVFTVEYESQTSIVSNTWEKSTDGGATWSTVTNGTVSLDENSATKTSTLTITGVSKADIALYRCVLENSGGSVTSEAAKLLLKDLIAHWTLDKADYVGDMYLDSTDYDHNANSIAKGGAIFVEGAGSATDGALSITDPNGVATAGTWDMTDVTGEFTFAAWVNWDGAARSALFTKRDSWSLNGMMFQITIESSGVLRIDRANTSRSSNNTVPAGQWSHVCITYDGSNLKMYINGIPSGNFTGWSPGKGTAATNIIGALTPDGKIATSTAALDDIRIYNYALTSEQVIDLSYPILQKSVCLSYPAMDIANGMTGLVKGDEGFVGDCKVDLYDFIALADAWLDCGLYPSTGCN